MALPGMKKEGFRAEPDAQYKNIKGESKKCFVQNVEIKSVSKQNSARNVGLPCFQRDSRNKHRL